MERPCSIQGTLVHSVLHHAVYGGAYVYGAYRYNRLTTRVVEENPNPTIVEGGVPAIIDRGLYLSVTQKLAQRKHRPKEKTRYVYILSGIMRCGECGARMSGDSTAKGRTPNYRCSGKACPHMYWRIGKKKIEKLVADVVWDKFLRGVTPEMVMEAIAESTAAIIREATTNIRNIKISTEQTKRTMDGLIDTMADPEMREITKPRILKKKKEFDELELALLNAERALRDAERETNMDMICQTLDKCLSSYQDWDETALRELIPIFIKRVTVWKNKVELEYTVTGGITVDTSRETGYIWQSLGDSNSC